MDKEEAEEEGERIAGERDGEEGCIPVKVSHNFVRIFLVAALVVVDHFHLSRFTTVNCIAGTHTPEV